MTLGLLALIGVDVGLSLLLGAGIGILNQLAINVGGLTDAVWTDSVSLNFAFFAVSRLLGLGLIVAFIRKRGISLQRFGFKRFKPLNALGLIFISTVILFIASGLIFYIAQQLAPDVNLNQEQEIIFTQASGNLQIALAFMALVIIAPIVEETIFRGFMLPAFARRFGIVPAAIFTSLLFGAIHWQLNVGIITFIMGLLLSWLYYATRSLWPAIMFHSLKNLLAFVLIFNIP